MLIPWENSLPLRFVGCLFDKFRQEFKVQRCPTGLNGGKRNHIPNEHLAPKLVALIETPKCPASPLAARLSRLPLGEKRQQLAGGAHKLTKPGRWPSAARP